MPASGSGPRIEAEAPVVRIHLANAVARLAFAVSDWFDVARAEQVMPGQGRTVSAGALRLALFNDGGNFFAIEDTCPHQGASLGEGLLHDGRVICPWHSWVFELGTGRCPRGSHAGVKTYETRCAGGVVSVRVPENESLPDDGTNRGE